MLEEILDYRNVQKALKQVQSNQGAGGIDGMQSDELRDYLEANWPLLKSSILEGTYCPSAVRKVEIPKASGGKRMLGIPTVKDRLLQQCLYQWLSPYYEGDFSDNSYGFRRGRNAHQAVEQARRYLNEEKEWIIESGLQQHFIFNEIFMEALIFLVTPRKGIENCTSMTLPGTRCRNHSNIVPLDGVMHLK